MSMRKTVVRLYASYLPSSDLQGHNSSRTDQTRSGLPTLSTPSPLTVALRSLPSVVGGAMIPMRYIATVAVTSQESRVFYV